jgi:hypothetical protein
VSVMSATTFPTPPPHRAVPRAVRQAADARVLADGLAGGTLHDARRRAQAAAHLAAALLEDRSGLTPAVARRLDDRLPGLLRAADRAGTPDAGPLSALCAALAGHLSPGVRRPLQSIVRHSPTRVAVAAHVASLLVDGVTPSAQLLADLAATAEVDPGPVFAARRRPLRTRAAILAYTLAVTEECPADAGSTAADGAAEGQHRTVRGLWR